MEKEEFTAKLSNMTKSNVLIKVSHLYNKHIYLKLLFFLISVEI